MNDIHVQSVLLTGNQLFSTLSKLSENLDSNAFVHRFPMCVWNSALLSTNTSALYHRGNKLPSWLSKPSLNCPDWIWTVNCTAEIWDLSRMIRMIEMHIFALATSIAAIERQVNEWTLSHDMGMVNVRKELLASIYHTLKQTPCRSYFGTRLGNGSKSRSQAATDKRSLRCKMNQILYTCL